MPSNVCLWVSDQSGTHFHFECKLCLRITGDLGSPAGTYLHNIFKSCGSESSDKVSLNQYLVRNQR